MDSERELEQALLAVMDYDQFFQSRNLCGFNPVPADSGAGMRPGAGPAGADGLRQVLPITKSLQISILFRLQTVESERDLEQDLLALMDYDQFSLVKELIRNRATIMWCTRLARAENEDAEKRIEVRAEYC